MIELPGHIALLSGPPGAGKTTTARVLAAQPGTPKVHLHADDFWRFIKTGAIPPYLPENAIVVSAVAQAAAAYAGGGYLVIVDGIIGPWFLAPFASLRVPVHYLVLRPPLAVAIERCRIRGGDTLNDPAHITALHQAFEALGDLERHVLPTVDQNPQATLTAVEHALLGGRFRFAADEVQS